MENIACFSFRYVIRFVVHCQTMFMFLCITSYMFVLQPAIPPPMLNGFYQINAETAYIEVTDDSKYALYVEGHFFRYLLEDELQVTPHDTLEIRK